MAQIFNQYSRIVPTWLAAAQQLEASGKTDSNLVLEISDIYTLNDFDHQILTTVDSYLKQYANLTVRTVAGTIFPQDLARRFSNREQLYAEYKKLIKRGKMVNSWGTYFGRMTERQDADGSIYNPLELLITRLISNSTGSRFYKSSFELGVAIPHIDLDDSVDQLEGEIPIFNPQTDARRWYGGPCLSHVSFKAIKVKGVVVLDMTAMYRSHHYCARALGNLLGLSQLLAFVAKSANMQAGKLTCISTHAELDTHKWGGDANTKILLSADPT